ncbi:MAG: hypothetical protein IIX93_05840, partial [Clostridia bacterium]|nr:hypothetical protein [Clostridia bacterium]
RADEGYRMMFGTLQDIMAVIDLDKMKSGNETELVMMAVKGFDLIAPIVMDVFPGLTEEELRRTDLNDLALLIVDIAREALGTMRSLKRGN